MRTMRNQEHVIGVMVASLDQQAKLAGVSLKGISRDNFNTFLDDLFKDGGEVRCVNFCDLADTYALQFGKMESKEYDDARFACIYAALDILAEKYGENKPVAPKKVTSKSVTRVLSPTAPIKKMIKNLATGKRMSRVFVTGKGWFGWNTAYHVYNSVDNYDQLKIEDLGNIEYDKQGGTT